MSKTLIYFPIIHTEADMGTLASSVRQATIHIVGRAGARQKLHMIDRLWSEIERTIDSLVLPYETVRLYQDGLPVCGSETQIVTKLAEAGARNHQLLLRLIEKGATLMGTESLELLMEEYALAKGVRDFSNRPKQSMAKMSRKAGSNSLLERRDTFIATRINETLMSGETGILFLGMLHSVGNKLDGDIRVVYPLKQPFSARGRIYDDK